MGGGNGSAITLNAVKIMTDKFDISAVISMSDSGGSSGRLRREFKYLPPGDILRAILALSPYDYSVLKKIFHSNRFEVKGKLNKHNLGNLFLILGQKYSGDYLKTLKSLEEVVEAQGRVYPVTLDQTDMQVELDNGKILFNEEQIDRPNHNRMYRIKKAWLKPEGKIFAGAKKAILEADYILLGPGSLYTSVIATLLPGGVFETIKKSKAKLVYVMGNGYEKEGETGPRKMSEFVNQLQKYLPKKLDAVIYNNHVLDKIQEEKYAKKKWKLFLVDLENLKDYKIITGDYERTKGGLCPEKLGEVLKKKILK